MKELEVIFKSIKNKTLLPIYYFHGDEPFYMDLAVKAFENELLEEDEKAFGQTVVYGKDTNYAEILSLAQQFPMFGNINLIIVKEAQDLKMSEDEQKMLESYIENPVTTTVLVFAHKHKKVDSRKKFVKNLGNKNMLFASEKVKDYQLAKWIADECQRLKVKTAPNISFLLAEYLGNELSRISNELQKIKLVLPEDAVLDGKLVETHIGISKEYNVFELQNALASKDSNRTFKIAHYMGKNPKTNPIVMTIGVLYSFFSNLIMYHTLIGSSPNEMAAEMGVKPFALKDLGIAARLYPLKFVTRIISILRETDLKSKGLGANQTDDAELLKEMVYKIINVEKTKVKL